MEIEEAYSAISGVFDGWVGVMEFQTRTMEMQDSQLKDLKVLMISPPTDRGIEILTEANPEGESCLLWFSPTVQRIVEKYATHCGLAGLAPGWSPPSGTATLTSSLPIVSSISVRSVTLTASCGKYAGH